MIRYLKIIFLLITIEFLTIPTHAEGYELKIRVRNMGGKELIFGHHLGDQLIPITKLQLDEVGIGTIKGEGKLPEGLYFFMIPKRARFDFFMTDAQQFVIETDSINLFNYLKFYNSPENSAAHEYLKSMVMLQRESLTLKDRLKTQHDSVSAKEIDSRLRSIALESNRRTSQLIDAQKNNFIGVYMRAMQEITVPEPPRDAAGKVIDSTFQYRYYRNHFFDNLDLRDARLTRTPVYLEKLKEYLDKVILQSPDSVYDACNKLLIKTEAYTEAFRFMLVNMFSHYAESKTMGFDAVYVKLAENWVLSRAAVSDSTFRQNVQENIARMKPVLIGRTAPDLKMLCPPAEHFIMAKSDTIAKKNENIGNWINLSDVKARYTLLIFWECDCGHCKKEVPELYEVYQKFKPKGVEGYVVHMLTGKEGKEKWIDFVNTHELYDWINAWSPVDAEYKKSYIFNTTPSVFILDAQKKILAKYLSPKQTEDFLNTRLALDEKQSQIKK